MLMPDRPLNDVGLVCCMPPIPPLRSWPRRPPMSDDPPRSGPPAPAPKLAPRAGDGVREFDGELRCGPKQKQKKIRR